MTLKVFQAPHLGRTVKLGRRRPISHGPRLSLKNYLDMSKIPPAPDCDYTSAAQPGLSDVLLNDRLGDCTCAGIGHVIDLVNCNAGTIVRVTDDQVLALYEAACNYNPNDPSSDQGGDEPTVLNYMADKGLDGNGLHKFVGSINVDACNQAEVRWAQWALGNLYFGEEMPEDYVDPFPSGSGFVWDVAGESDPDNGHCFVGCGSNSQGVIIDTWGLLGIQTYAAIGKYAMRSSNGELHSILTKEWLNSATQKTPSGFAYNDLVSDLRAIGALI